MSWVAIGLESFDQGAQAWSENDEIARAGCGSVGVRRACGNEYCCSGSGGLRSVDVAKGEFAFEDVPCLVVGVMDVEGVYDPCRPNDRLLLGMKGSISEFELSVIRSRMLDAKFAAGFRRSQ